MARELGIHRNTVRKYIDAESPPTRRSPTASTEAASGTIQEPAGDIFPEQLKGPLSLNYDSHNVRRSICPGGPLYLRLLHKRSD